MFFTRPNSEKRNETNSRESFNQPINEIHMLVPIQDYEQGRLAISILRNNHNDLVKSIHIFQCIKDRVVSGGFVNALELIQECDAQAEHLEKALLKLQRLAEVLANDLPDVRITFNAKVHDSVSESIVEEAELVNATMILFIQDPKRKRHWLIPGVSNRVLRTAPCSVQIIKPSKQVWLPQVIVA